jgi:putative N6-adenine-specific DNA methylase
MAQLRDASIILLLALFASLVAVDGLRSFYATCSRGIEPILLKEVSALPEVKSVKQARLGVFFEGTTKCGFSALMNLRTSLKLMERIDTSTSNSNEGGEGQVRSPQALYDYCYDSVDWPALIDPHSTTFSVSVTLGQAVAQDLTHSHFSALTVKDAIVDRVQQDQQDRQAAAAGAPGRGCDGTNADAANANAILRPSVDRYDADVPISVYLHRDTAAVYRVLSGASSMHKRGYRGEAIHKAALRESTAAALILATGWRGQGGGNSNPQEQGLLCDPMGGGGTLCIEAALIAADTAPGLIRYATAAPKACRWPDLQQQDQEEGVLITPHGGEKGSSSPQSGAAAWEEVVAEARSRDKRAAGPVVVHYNDVHAGAVHLARESARGAGVSHMIAFHTGDISEYAGSCSSTGVVIVTNPPWDRRLQGGAEESWDLLNSFARSQKEQRRRLHKNDDANDANDANEEQPCVMYCLAGEPALLKRLDCMRPVSNLALETGGVEMRFVKFQ